MDNESAEKAHFAIKWRRPEGLILKISGYPQSGFLSRLFRFWLVTLLSCCFFALFRVVFLLHSRLLRKPFPEPVDLFQVMSTTIEFGSFVIHCPSNIPALQANK
jgi:hypothetical protein